MRTSLLNARTIARRHPVLAGAFAISLAATLFFAVNAGMHAVRWKMRGVEPIAPWMTVGYIAKPRGIDPREIDGITGFPTPDPDPYTLQQIADERGVPVEQIIEEVKTAIRALKRGEVPEPDGASRP